MFGLSLHNIFWWYPSQTASIPDEKKVALTILSELQVDLDAAKTRDDLRGILDSARKKAFQMNKSERGLYTNVSAALTNAIEVHLTDNIAVFWVADSLDCDPDNSPFPFECWSGSGSYVPQEPPSKRDIRNRISPAERLRRFGHR